jgi:hypothetical protein
VLPPVSVCLVPNWTLDSGSRAFSEQEHQVVCLLGLKPLGSPPLLQEALCWQGVEFRVPLAGWGGRES